MLYLVILPVIALLGLLALKVRKISARPSKQIIESLQKKAAESIAAGRWEAASHIVRSLFQAKLGGMPTVVLYAQILRGMKQCGEAKAAIDQALKSAPKDSSLLQEKGRILLEQGYAKEALVILERSNVAVPSEEDLIDIASAFFQTGAIDRAWETLADLIPESVNGRMFSLAGDCQFRWKRYEEAIPLYLKAQHCGWNNQRILARLGNSLMGIGKVVEAEHYFQMILASDSSDVIATLGLGSCYEAKGQFDKALLVYQGGEAWDRGDARILQQAGFCAALTQVYEFADLYLMEALRRGVNSPKVLTYLGYSLEKQKKWQEAEQVYLRLVQEHKEHVAGYRALAWLYGVGLSTTLSREAGLAMAHHGLTLLSDRTAWELVSACEARAGNFHMAHDIQEHLSAHIEDRTTRLRRRNAMRVLRKRIPLDETLVCSAMVA